MKIVALDYGRARTGVAVSDPSGTLARPVGGVERAAAEAGLAEIAAIVEREGAEKVVVGLPLTLRGERGAQAQETERFVAALRAVLVVTVEYYDERFTSTLAQGDDAQAAAYLLSSYLERHAT